MDVEGEINLQTLQSWWRLVRLKIISNRRGILLVGVCQSGVIGRIGEGGRRRSTGAWTSLTSQPLASMPSCLHRRMIAPTVLFLPEDRQLSLPFMNHYQQLPRIEQAHYCSTRPEAGPHNNNLLAIGDITAVISPTAHALPTAVHMHPQTTTVAGSAGVR